MYVWDLVLIFGRAFASESLSVVSLAYEVAQLFDRDVAGEQVVLILELHVRSSFRDRKVDRLSMSSGTAARFESKAWVGRNNSVSTHNAFDCVRSRLRSK